MIGISQLLNAAGASGITPTRSTANSSVNVAAVNAAKRAEYTEVKPECTIKVVAQPRVFGVRSHGGSKMAKSAIRLAIDTKVAEPTKFEKTGIKSQSKMLIGTATAIPSEDAVQIMDQFEKSFGGLATEGMDKLQQAYKAAKADICTKERIPVDSSGRPMFTSKEQSDAYFEAMKDKTYTGFEVYLSVKPEGVRATRSKSFRMEFDPEQLFLVLKEQLIPEISWTKPL